MRKKNKITNEKRVQGLLDSHYVKTLPIYQKGDDITYDVEDADKTLLGEPIQMEFSSKHTTTHDVYERTKPISFDPTKPQSRLLALEARSYVNRAFSESQIYMDKLDCAKYSNDCIDAFANNLKNTNLNNHE